ncbi:MAG: GspH/FimT family pseudopilin [Desulfobacterales bacterium]|nr:GspH/FimT family pseudopilin [Desulfobacterales bacterium]
MKNHPKNRVRSDDGFTLIELLTIISIISLMSALAIPNFFEWRQSAKLNSAIQTLTSDLAMARMHAIKLYNSTGSGVDVVFAANGYTIFIDDDNDNVIDTGEAVLRNKTYPAGVSMNAVTFTGSRTVFHRAGSVSPAGSVTLNHGSGLRMRVVVSFVGRIRVETI